VQVAAAAMFVSQIPLPDFLVDSFGDYAALWMVPAVFFIVSVTNIYNFMDGLDGLTAGHSCVVLTSWIAFSGLFAVTGTEMLVCVALLVPLLGFLIFNWHPARAFMGDVGSTFLGFTFSCLALMQIGELPRFINFFALLMLMMPFLFDATFTILSRYLRGEDWYLPHRLHIFQRLYDQGVSQSRVVCLYIGLTLYMGILLILSRSTLFGNASGAILFMAPYPILYGWLWWLEHEDASQSKAEAC
jgi:UDP-N-acetylmuramyl pentapeptide phosphotransferase/UDP-N-acetylglucosamine-1-phosphate transferase